MGFNSVYQTLKELFPQVDARLLKAVAIEHAKDPNAAVETILTEIFPFMCEKSSVATPIVCNVGNVAETHSKSSSIVELLSGNNADDSHLLSDAHNMDDDSLATSFYDANDTDDLQNGNSKNEDLTYKEVILGATKAKELNMSGSSTSVDNKDDFVQDCVTHVHVVSNGTADVSSTINTEYREVEAKFDGVSNLIDVINELLSDDHQRQHHLDCNTLDFMASTNQTPISVTQPEVENRMPSEFNNEQMSCHDAYSLQDFPVTDLGVVEVEPETQTETALSTIVTQSGLICRISLVEEIIEDAKTYKDTLLTETESVLRLIEDVEDREKEAEQARAAAARGGFDILEKVEEMKKMLEHAKEANEMHAGEVYGEKSILATEVRELQTRLLGLADEKDKSLSTLEEMRKTLEERLAASEEEKKAAEKELLMKEEIARGALVEQELIMEKVVHQSKMLQQEAEENAKLRDFLVEKGRLVDELQGEIGVICQDVKSLKEKFDNRVSFSKSRSIEQTSFRMASSISSGKSITSDSTSGALTSSTSSVNIVSETATGYIMALSETPGRMSPALSVECQTPKSNVEDVVIQPGTTHGKVLSDEDWVLFDA
ncbi:uncharacterized protein LOC130814026 isoform X2 [Amaranthus tricolor]|nr:uncharacterized protein LOC130814026 isoform X2 [Amaranthus tricolor]XP_057535983.1 uncharacterized protein LOC130814026 isoform X2 [Amaranthus tricolor]XP_057535984.1 uncharacterized protein LOC130814026 isoform X2 [Amaranthus tricolor]